MMNDKRRVTVGFNVTLDTNGDVGITTVIHRGQCLGYIRNNRKHDKGYGFTALDKYENEISDSGETFMNSLHLVMLAATGARPGTIHSRKV